MVPDAGQQPGAETPENSLWSDSEPFTPAEEIFDENDMMALEAWVQVFTTVHQHLYRNKAL